MSRPKDPRTFDALTRIMAGTPVRDVAESLGLDRSHLYRLLKAAGLTPPAHNKRGRKANLSPAPELP